MSKLWVNKKLCKVQLIEITHDHYTSKLIVGENGVNSFMEMGKQTIGDRTVWWVIHYRNYSV